VQDCSAVRCEPLDSMVLKRIGQGEKGAGQIC
jgi:hypothetical protein